MITCLDICNRAIGNALFNYYFLLRVAQKTKYKAYYPTSQEFMHHSGQRIQQLEEGFDIKIPKKGATFLSKYIKYVYREHQDNMFDQEVFSIKDNTNFDGYFQNKDYFDLSDNLGIEFNTKTINESKDILNKLKLNAEQAVSIHVRRGDYLKIDRHPVQSMEYYEQAIKHFPEKCFLVFSDDYDWVKENFDGDRFFCFPPQYNAFIDLCCMSLCSDNIIANSTFSWWAAFLNKNVDKKVIYPDNWIKGIDMNIFPKEWISL
jgi:hypothetical protein